VRSVIRTDGRSSDLAPRRGRASQVTTLVSAIARGPVRGAGTSRCESALQGARVQIDPPAELLVSGSPSP